jgi:CRP/FNR family transcriptional regulator, cyclic AMP receptor protein
MAFSTHTERRHLARHLAKADTCIDARIELLQRMPIFGGIRAEVLQFLLGLCPVVRVLTNEFFFREHDQADSMFVLETGKVAVLKSCRGQEYVLSILKEGDVWLIAFLLRR